MSDLRELYQQVILDHSRKPRNFGLLEPPAQSAEGNNPLCGDVVKVYVALEGDTVRDVRFEGNGCAISTSSASLMTEAIKGKNQHTEQVRTPTDRLRIRPPDEIEQPIFAKTQTTSGSSRSSPEFENSPCA